MWVKGVSKSTMDRLFLRHSSSASGDEDTHTTGTNPSKATSCTAFNDMKTMKNKEEREEERKGRKVEVELFFLLLLLSLE